MHRLIYFAVVVLEECGTGEAVKITISRILQPRKPQRDWDMSALISCPERASELVPDDYETEMCDALSTLAFRISQSEKFSFERAEILIESGTGHPCIEVKVQSLRKVMIRNSWTLIRSEPNPLYAFRTNFGMYASSVARNGRKVENEVAVQFEHNKVLREVLSALEHEDGHCLEFYDIGL